MTQLWCNKYIGTPWREFGRAADGCDCWGLACLVYRNELGIELPSYAGAYTSAEERREIAALIGGATRSPLWHAAPGRPEEFDVAVFRRGQFASHVGIVVRPGLMLHMSGEDCAKIEDYRQPLWRTRLTGIWRHETRVEGAVK